MRYRTLGRTGLQVSEIGFGAWGIGQKQWLGGADEESLRALRRAVELGVNFIDTALAYGDGHSERLVGQVLRDYPRLLVATKIPPKNRTWPAAAGVSIQEVFPYDYAMRCMEESLRNLGVETVTLQQFHVWNPEWLASDEWRRVVRDVKESGKARFFGISVTEHQPDSVIEAVKTGLIDTVQVIYNIWDQSAEKRLFPVCQERGVGVIARVPLDEGSLTGAIEESTVFEAGEFRDWYFRGRRKREVAERVAALRKDLAGVPGTLAEIALRFCISSPAVSTVIPGMRRMRNVESSCSVSEAGRLPEEVLKIVRKHAWSKNYYQ
jgi:aryl-alcohol dehydrogenase-like predicted oxidoreductase